MKICSVCKETKPLTEFYSQNKYSKKKGNYIYYNPTCKECLIEKTLNKRNENREENLEKMRNYFNEQYRTNEKLRNRQKENRKKFTKLGKQTE